MELNTHNYKKILTALSLSQFWKKQLEQNNAKVNGTSLRMLSDIKEEISDSTISRRIYTQNGEIRKLAKSVHLELSNNNSFRFLEDDFDKDFNSLDEIRIHAALKEKQKEKPLPLLVRWVNLAKNPKYKAFLIKEIGLFNQEDCASNLLDLYIEEENSLVKKELISTLGKLKHKPAVDTFIQDFNYASQEIQQTIIKAIGNIGGDEALSFLKTICFQSHDKEMTIEILQNIRLIDSQGNIYNELKNKASSEFEKTAIAYVELNSTPS